MGIIDIFYRDHMRANRLAIFVNKPQTAVTVKTMIKR